MAATARTASIVRLQCSACTSFERETCKFNRKFAVTLALLPQSWPAGPHRNLKTSQRKSVCFSRTQRWTTAPLKHYTESGSAFRPRAAEGTDMIETAEVDTESEALESLRKAAQILAGLDTDFLKNLPQDLQADAKFSGFQLANGPLDREVGESAANVLGNLGRAFESLDTKSAAAAARGLENAAKTLPLKSSERARFGKRLAAFAGPLRSGDCEELKQVARALSVAGKSISEGAEEKPIAPPGPESKVLKFGSLQVELTRQKAFGGVIVAFVFGFFCARLTAGLQSIEPDSLSYANDSALALAQSLRVTLLAAGWSCTAMSGFAAIGLLALGSQLNPRERDST